MLTSPCNSPLRSARTRWQRNTILPDKFRHLRTPTMSGRVIKREQSPELTLADIPTRREEAATSSSAKPPPIVLTDTTVRRLPLHLFPGIRPRQVRPSGGMRSAVSKKKYHVRHHHPVASMPATATGGGIPPQKIKLEEAHDRSDPRLPPVASSLSSDPISAPATRQQQTSTLKITNAPVRKLVHASITRLEQVLKSHPPAPKIPPGATHATKMEEFDFGDQLGVAADEEFDVDSLDGFAGALHGIVMCCSTCRPVVNNEQMMRPRQQQCHTPSIRTSRTRSITSTTSVSVTHR